MSWMDGISRCSPLGAHCVVWWEAWAVVAAVIGVAATLFVGLMTLRLGKAANAASKAALEISLADAKLRIQRDRDERLILLMRMHPEVKFAVNNLERLCEKIGPEPGPEILESHPPPILSGIYQVLDAIAFPEYGAVGDRLYILGNPLAARLARGVKLYEVVRFAVRSQSRPEDMIFPSNLASALRIELPPVLEDLRVVNAECEAAEEELGLSQLKRKMADTEEAGEVVLRVATCAQSQAN